MKKFQFRLQSVLNLREQELEQIQLKLAGAQHQQIQLQQQSNNLQGYIEELMENPLPTGENGPLLQQQLLFYLNGLRNQQAELNGQMSQQQKIIEVIQEELRIALSKKQGLDKLKEKKYSDYKADWQAHQQLEMEDLVSARQQFNQR